MRISESDFEWLDLHVHSLGVIVVEFFSPAFDDRSEVIDGNVERSFETVEVSLLSSLYISSVTSVSVIFLSVAFVADDVTL